ncbi:quinon protein alcohol dehydrogenase-like superfamily [Irpex rosettiformis]|uniref:Quinon protein alcohol dehydrogenase-like superfamily n=1 Tax=Irpex rosettiformis TaxID=378272 RepID=A0ACB8TUX5_9APHY|nr:quinon protein alcohol dehydrogenase-like superfamily [Irpex rosettiformis]
MSLFATIYATELAYRGLGHGLWYPEGSKDSPEVEIGDVGLINHLGAFTPLFSIDERYKNDKMRRMEKYIPKNDCSYFDFGTVGAELAVYPHCSPPGTEYHSRNIRKKEIVGRVEGGVQVAGAKLELSYSIDEDCGAVCILPQGGEASEIDGSTRLKEFIKINIEKWHNHIKAHRDIKLEDLIVIRGFLKSSQCKIMAIHSSSKSKGVDASARIFESVGFGLHVKLDTKGGVRHEERSLPVDRDHHGTPADKMMTMFAQYYKLKARFLRRKIVANAGPDVLPPGEDPADDIPIIVDENDQETSGTKAYQPVDALLDYILETSPEAERAFASDEEVCSLYLGEVFPNDVLASLREKRPRIVVDEHKVGTMPLDDVIRRERVYKITGRGLGATPSDNDEMVEPPMRNGIVTFRDSKGKDTALDWPHQHLSDKAQQQGSLKTTAVSCDGKLVAVGFDDATIILWDLATGRVVSRPEGHEDGIYALAFSPNGARLASASADMKVIVWTVIADEGEGMTDVAENDFSILEGHEQEVTKLAYSPDGSRLVSASLDGTMKIWDASSAYELLRSINNITCPNWLCITPDSTKIVATMDNLVYVWNISDGKQVATMRGHDTNIYMTAISHDGTRVATASEDETARVWNVENGEELLTLHEHTSSVWCIAFSPDDNNVVTGSDDTTIVVADSWTGERRRVFTDCPGFVNTVEYSKSGEFICSGTLEGRIRLLNARTGEFVAEYQGHSDKIKSITFSPDEESIISSSEDGTVRTFSVTDFLRLR